jgi:hypothetical protein
MLWSAANYAVRALQLDLHNSVMRKYGLPEHVPKRSNRFKRTRKGKRKAVDTGQSQV